jgi:hypothetical protein
MAGLKHSSGYSPYARATSVHEANPKIGWEVDGVPVKEGYLCPCGYTVQMLGSSKKHTCHLNVKMKAASIQLPFQGYPYFAVKRIHWAMEIAMDEDVALIHNKTLELEALLNPEVSRGLDR